jgi:hypothetical protein
MTNQNNDDGGGMVAHPMSEVTPRIQRWLSDGRIPLRTVTLLVGDGGLGKSTYGFGLAARVSRGQEPGEFRNEPRDVLILTAEDAEAETIVPRLYAAGADLARVHTVRFAGDEMVTIPDHVPGLVKTIAQTGAALLIIDPVVSFLGSSVDAHVDKEIRRSLSPLAKAAEDTEVAVLGLVHTNKSSARALTQKIGGSVGFRNTARSVLYWAMDPEGVEGGPERVLIHEKCNVGPLQPTIRYRIETRDTEQRDPDSDEPIHAAALANLGIAENVTASMALAIGHHDDEDDRSPTQRDLALELIVETLRQGAATWDELKALSAAEGISERTARRARDKLVQENRVAKRQEGFHGGWKWYLAAPHLSIVPGESPEVDKSGETQAGNAYPARENPHLHTLGDSPGELTKSEGPDGADPGTDERAET